MDKRYYYLICSLPFLRLDDYKGPYRVREFVSELYDNLTPLHCGYVRGILYMNDNTHLVDCALSISNRAGGRRIHFGLT